MRILTGFTNDRRLDRDRVEQRFNLLDISMEGNSILFQGSAAATVGLDKCGYLEITFSTSVEYVRELIQRYMLEKLAEQGIGKTMSWSMDDTLKIATSDTKAGLGLETDVSNILGSNISLNGEPVAELSFNQFGYFQIKFAEGVNQTNRQEILTHVLKALIKHEIYHTSQSETDDSVFLFLQQQYNEHNKFMRITYALTGVEFNIPAEISEKLLVGATKREPLNFSAPISTYFKRPSGCASAHKDRVQHKLSLMAGDYVTEVEADGAEHGESQEFKVKGKFDYNPENFPPAAQAEWNQITRYAGTPNEAVPYRKGCFFCPSGRARWQLLARFGTVSVLGNYAPYNICQSNRPIHLLLIPTRHVENMRNTTPFELREMAHTKAIIKGILAHLGPVLFFTQNGDGQTVGHAHCHAILMLKQGLLDPRLWATRSLKEPLLDKLQFRNLFGSVKASLAQAGMFHPRKWLPSEEDLEHSHKLIKA